MKKYTLIFSALCLINSVTHAEQEPNNAREKDSATLLVGNLHLRNKLPEALYYQARTLMNGKIGGSSFKNTTINKEGTVAPDSSESISALIRVGTPNGIQSVWGEKIALCVALCSISESSELELTTPVYKFMIADLNGNYIIRRSANGALECVHIFRSRFGWETSRKVRQEASDDSTQS